MDGSPRRLEVFPDHFEVSTPAVDLVQTNNTPNSQPGSGSFSPPNSSSTRRKLMKAASMLSLFSPRRLSWGTSTDCHDKVELSAVEVESLRSEIVNLEEREAHLKAQLEHIDEVLRSARLAGYLYIRTRWTALPGEPPIDDTDVDDWLPRFVVLHGPCIFFYLQSTDLSPQDSTLLSDVVEIGPLPSIMQEDEQTRYSFFILTRQGLRLECSNHSKIQVDSWLTVLQSDCKVGHDAIGCEDYSNVLPALQNDSKSGLDTTVHEDCSKS